MRTRRIALRSLANGKIVCAEAGGDQPLIANRDGIGAWEEFELIELDEGNGMPHPTPQPAPPPFVPPQPAPAPGLPDRPSPGSGRPVLDRVVRVTSEADGEFVPRMYSYWSNAVVLADGIYVFAGHADGVPRWFRVSRSGQVERLGSLGMLYRGTTEGWYCDADGWIYLIDGPRLRLVSPFTDADRIVFSIEQTHPGCVLWQAHSSDDGRTHSATVLRPTSDGPYQRIGTVVWHRGRELYYEAKGDLDESHISGNGRFLLIEEDNDLIVHDLTHGSSLRLADHDGALAHLDCGPDYIVGEDNFAGACVRLDLPSMQRRTLFSTWGMGHLSIRNGVCLLSDSTHLSLVSLQGGSVVSFLAHGMRSDGTYDTQVKANLDPTGKICCYMSNMGGSRFDVFVAPVPA